MSRGITFAGNSLQTTTSIVTQVIDTESIPTKNMPVFTIGHANRSTIPFYSYPSKTIKVSGTIYGTSPANLDGVLDTFRGYFNGIDQNLDIDYNGSTRRFIATVNTLSIDRPGGLSYADFSLEFICTQPYGQDTTVTTALNQTGRTLATYTDSYTFLGSAPWQRPIITITYTALTGGTSKAINFGNNNNGQQITVTRTWTTGDIVTIDSSKKTVTVNGIDTDFTGAFPEFPPGIQSFGYSDALTTRTFNINVTYYVLYL